MYAAHPAERVLALESTRRPLIPKSQSLMLPRSSISMFEGFTSRWMTPCLTFRYDKALTVCKERLEINRRISLSTTRSYRHCDLAQDLLRHGLLRELEQLVKAHGHQLHADPHVRVADEAAEALDNVLAVVGLEHHIQVHQDALVLLRVARAPHLLHGDDHVAGQVHHLHHIAAGPVPQVAQVLQVVDIRRILPPVNVQLARLLHDDL